MKEDFYLSSLMVSKLCHDLIGSSSSLSFSLETLQKDETLNKEAINLAYRSAEVFVNRLKYFRLAFGSAYLATDPSVEINLKSLIFELYKEKDIRINWSEKSTNLLKDFLKGSNIKLFLNIFLLVFYNLPQNATVSLIVVQIDLDEIAVMIKVEGYKFYLKELIIKILNDEVTIEKINPSNIHIYFISFLKKMLNSRIEINNSQEGLKLAFSLKKY